MAKRFFFASIFVAFSFTLMLTLFEIGRITLDYIHSAQRRLAIQIYLKKNLTEQEKLEIGKILVRLAGVRQVEYIAGEEAKVQFIRSYPEYKKVIDLFRKIPLPEGYRLSVDGPFLRKPYIDHLINEISAIRGVEEISFKYAWADKLERMESIFYAAGSLFVGIVAIGAFLIFPFVVGYVLTWGTSEIPMVGQPAGAVVLGVVTPSVMMWVFEKLFLKMQMPQETWNFVLIVGVVAALASEIVVRIWMKKPSES